jgi:hypothetical protein
MYYYQKVTILRYSRLGSGGVALLELYKKKYLGAVITYNVKDVNKLS